MKTYICPLAPRHPIHILYEDNHVIAALKPAGILSQADKSGAPDMLNILKLYLKEKYHKEGDVWLGLLQRLDRPVAGVMIFARNSKSAARLSAQIRERTIEKEYLAVVHDHVEETEGQWVDQISRQKLDGRYQTMEDEGEDESRYSSLKYRCLAYHDEPKLSLLKIQLETGRSHQIRVQCASRKHPIPGDRRYGISTAIDRKLDSPALFAYAVVFEHPVKHEQIRVSFNPSAIYPFSLFADRLMSED